MKKILRIATRKSQLALWQANWVAKQLTDIFPDLEIEFLKIVTQGDKILDKSLSDIGGKGLFVKELEHALISNQADLAVHSLKDMPALQPDGLELSVFCARADARDILIAREGLATSLANMPHGAVIGTASLRRCAQLKIFRPDLNIVPLRGNIDTRLQKLNQPDLHPAHLDGIILAAAGVQRLYNLNDNLNDNLNLNMLDNDPITEYLPIANFLPAPGQGIVTIEVRSEDVFVKDLIKKLNCPLTTFQAKAERAFNNLIGGSCDVPIAAFAEIKANQSELVLCGQVASPDGSQQITASLSGNVQNAVDIGEQLANQILAAGGRSIIANLNLNSSLKRS
ncbi:MAG: hydroxymethylbilane synthase [Gammaproteobacteria bacterium]|nr:hydroxymethylbilane synthase [Gammaproteobacteria bacterium]